MEKSQVTVRTARALQRQKSRVFPDLSSPGAIGSYGAYSSESSDDNELEKRRELYELYHSTVITSSRVASATGMASSVTPPQSKTTPQRSPGHVERQYDQPQPRHTSRERQQESSHVEHGLPGPSEPTRFAASATRTSPRLSSGLQPATQPTMRSTQQQQQQQQQHVLERHEVRRAGNLPLLSSPSRSNVDTAIAARTIWDDPRYYDLHVPVSSIVKQGVSDRIEDVFRPRGQAKATTPLPARSSGGSSIAPSALLVRGAFLSEPKDLFGDSPYGFIKAVNAKVAAMEAEEKARQAAAAPTSGTGATKKKRSQRSLTTETFIDTSTTLPPQASTSPSRAPRRTESVPMRGVTTRAATARAEMAAKESSPDEYVLIRKRRIREATEREEGEDRPSKQRRIIQETTSSIPETRTEVPSSQGQPIAPQASPPAQVDPATIAAAAMALAAQGVASGMATQNAPPTQPMYYPYYQPWGGFSWLPMASPPSIPAAPVPTVPTHISPASSVPTTGRQDEASAIALLSPTDPNYQYYGVYPQPGVPLPPQFSGYQYYPGAPQEQVLVPPEGSGGGGESLSVQEELVEAAAERRSKKKRSKDREKETRESRESSKERKARRKEKKRLREERKGEAGEVRTEEFQESPVPPAPPPPPLTLTGGGDSGGGGRDNDEEERRPTIDDEEAHDLASHVLYYEGRLALLENRAEVYKHTAAQLDRELREARRIIEGLVQENRLLQERESSRVQSDIMMRTELIDLREQIARLQGR